MTKKGTMVKGQQKKKSIPPNRHEKIAHTRKGKNVMKPSKITKQMDANRVYWIRPDFRGITTKVTLSTKITVLQGIAETLKSLGGEDLVNQFRDGPFGSLLVWANNGPSASAPLVELLSYQIKSEDVSSLLFLVGGSVIRFGVGEFALVTGLNFGSSTFDPCSDDLDVRSRSSVFRKLCPNKPLQATELFKMFKERRVDPNDQQLYLRIANILACWCFVLGYQERRIVESWLYVLVEDLGRWNAFPWGAYAYQSLLHYLSAIPTTRDRMAVSTLTLHGPIWALQVWAYEAIPELGLACSTLAHPDLLPRFAKWKFVKANVDKWGSWKAFFARPEINVYPTLVASADEQNAPYYMSALMPQPLGVSWRHPENAVPPKKKIDDGLYIDDRGGERSQPGGDGHEGVEGQELEAHVERQEHEPHDVGHCQSGGHSAPSHHSASSEQEASTSRGSKRKRRRSNSVGRLIKDAVEEIKIFVTDLFRTSRCAHCTNAEGLRGNGLGGHRALSRNMDAHTSQHRDIHSARPTSAQPQDDPLVEQHAESSIGQSGSRHSMVRRSQSQDPHDASSTSSTQRQDDQLLEQQSETSSRHGRSRRSGARHNQSNNPHLAPPSSAQRHDDQEEVSKFINNCNEMKAATDANKDDGHLSIVKTQADSSSGAKK